MHMYKSEISGDVVIGYQSQKDDGIYLFPVKRIIQAEIIRHEGETYLRVGELASLLGLGQKSQFAANIRKKLGAESLLSGERSRPFRTSKDSDKTTFITAKNMLFYLEQTNAAKEGGYRDEIIRALRIYAD